MKMIRQFSAEGQDKRISGPGNTPGHLCKGCVFTHLSSNRSDLFLPRNRARMKQKCRRNAAFDSTIASVLSRRRIAHCALKRPLARSRSFAVRILAMNG
jgi:hypothetical protein